jgi:hypothetical protein
MGTNYWQCVENAARNQSNLPSETSLAIFWRMSNALGCATVTVFYVKLQKMGVVPNLHHAASIMEKSRESEAMLF